MNLQSACIPVLASYEDAKEHYEEVKPLRSGAKKGLKPLGHNRRYFQCLITHDAEANAYNATLYENEVVKWLPDGEIHVCLCGYDTPSTRQVIYATTGHRLKHDRGTTYINVNGGWYGFDDGNYTMRIKDNEVINPAQQYAFKIDRSAMKTKRKEFGAFIEYVGNMGKVVAGIKASEVNATVQSGQVVFQILGNGQKMMSKISLPSSGSYYVRDIGNAREVCKNFLQEVKQAQEAEDLEKIYALFVQLGASSLHFNSRLDACMKSWAGNAQEDGTEIGEPMLNYFDEIIKHVYREEVFVKAEVPVGVKVSNANRKYFI